MQMTLLSLVSYDSFDWTCRDNKAALLKNLVVVVLQLFGISKVELRRLLSLIQGRNQDLQPCAKT